MCGDARPLRCACRGISLALWLLFDHLQWLQKAGYLRLAPGTLAKVDAYHSQAWFSGLLFGALLCLYKLQLLAKEERRFIAAMPLPPSSSDLLKRNDVTEVSRKALLALEEKKAKQVRTARNAPHPSPAPSSRFTLRYRRTQPRRAVSLRVVCR